MFKNGVYPHCANSFKIWCNTNAKFSKIYKNMGSPRPFDVSLRDGLQSLSKEQQINFSFNDKTELYHIIKRRYKPLNIEIGSYSSSKLLPVFKDTNIFLDYCENINKYLDSYIYQIEKSNHYVVVPNENKLDNAIENKTICHYSFITSVSNSFQLKNVNMTLDESIDCLEKMFQKLNNFFGDRNNYKVKLYVSCINECPIEGKINNSVIIDLLHRYSLFKPNTICLSDTCGTLTFADFKEILEGLIDKNLNLEIFSLHLHVKHYRHSVIEKIIHHALDNGITDFDVSLLDTGGCSITMNNAQLAPNLSYDLYYKSLCKYIESKSNENIEKDEEYSKKVK
jgi:isopropylmalate/homocitrate/citramalate synthase